MYNALRDVDHGGAGADGGQHSLRRRPHARARLCYTQGKPTITSLNDRAGKRPRRFRPPGRSPILVDTVLRRRRLHQDHGLPAARQQRYLAHTDAPDFSACSGYKIGNHSPPSVPLRISNDIGQVILYSLFYYIAHVGILLSHLCKFSFSVNHEAYSNKPSG